MATTPYFEGYEPAVQAFGLNSAKNVDFSASTSVTLPSGTTIGGSSVVALGAISNAITTGAGLSITTSGVYTGTGFVIVAADSATTGTVNSTSSNGLTTGHNTVITSTGTITTTGDLLAVTGNSATTSTGVVRVSTTGLTTGSSMLITGGGANQTSAGKVLELAMGASTVGVGASVTTTGVYTGAGIVQLTANSATTGTVLSVSGTGITSGKGLLITGTAATLTTGRYVSVNDSAGEVFGIGANGHIHSTVGAVAPTIAVTSQAGITAAAITAGGSDTCGTITTTGTSTGATILDVTFNKTYTTAPKMVVLTPANAAASMPNTSYFVSAISATTFTITVAAGGTYAATPSFRYLVVA